MANKRENYVQEARGLRQVGMFVQEFFCWGWQPYGQENDDGIDGIIIIRNSQGDDLGVQIKVQIKSGLGYYKGMTDDGKLKIQPYSPKAKLKSRLELYKRQIDPTILVFVTNEWEGNKDNYRLKAWWVRLDNYQYDDSSYIYIDKRSRFGEHSKKELFKLVESSIKWDNCITINASPADKKLFNNYTNLKKEAKKVYDNLRSTPVDCKAFNDAKVHFTRLGWRHINDGRRGRGRIRNSLGLISIVPQIVQQANLWIWARKSKKANYNHYFYTPRANVDFGEGEKLKVQVIIRLRLEKKTGNGRFEFYSVHVMKK